MPQNSQMRVPDTLADGEMGVTVVPGGRTVGGQDKKSQRSKGRTRGASGPGTKLHEKVGGPGCALCRVLGQRSYPECGVMRKET